MTEKSRIKGITIFGLVFVMVFTLLSPTGFAEKVDSTAVFGVL